MATLPSKLHFTTTSAATSSPKITYVIYFITGNPGLIAYYTTFLEHLHSKLQARFSSSSIAFNIYGRSLSGYELTGERNSSLNWPRASTKEKRTQPPPFDVNQQIERSAEGLRDVIRSARANGANDLRVILMGHSLGTYMSLEMIRRLRAESIHDPDSKESVKVVGAVLLFATVMNLAGSPSGLRVQRLLALPYFALVTSSLARMMMFFLPTFLLAGVIRIVMRFPADAASVTAAFLKSPFGVQQALYLAHDEMQELSTDKWDTEIWGATSPPLHSHPRPILHFLFAKKDHWIADNTRDELIKARGASKDESDAWKPKMEIDETGEWTHGFCINQSIPVANKAVSYIENIVKKNSGL